MDRITWNRRNKDHVEITVETMADDTLLFISVKHLGVDSDIVQDNCFEIDMIGKYRGEMWPKEPRTPVTLWEKNEFFPICQMAVDGDNIGKAASNLIYFFTKDLQD